MSSDLLLYPLKRKSFGLSDDLKEPFRSEYGYPVKCVLTLQDMPFIKGLKACKIEGVDKLIELLEKFEEVRVEEGNW